MYKKLVTASLVTQLGNRIPIAIKKGRINGGKPLFLSKLREAHDMNTFKFRDSNWNIV